MDCSLGNRKDASKYPEAQGSYFTYINISSARARPDEKNLAMAWIDCYSPAGDALSPLPFIFENAQPDTDNKRSIT